MFLHQVKRHGERQHRDNDEKASKVTTDAGDGGGCDQECDKRIENTLAEPDKKCLAMNGFGQVGPIHSQTLRRLPPLSVRLIGFVVRPKARPEADAKTPYTPYSHIALAASPIS